MDRLRTGILAGLVAGIIMGIVAVLFFYTGVFTLNPMVILANLVMTEAMAATVTGFIVGIIISLVVAAFYGVVFTFLLKDRENSIYWGITYGVALYFISPGIIGPALGIFPPLWESNLPNNIGALVTRVIYGAVLGYLVHIWLRDPAQVNEGGGEGQ